MKNTIVFIGKSNVGKSTLFNNILKNDFSIVTNKRYTTNRCIEKYLNEDTLFIDTPGPIIKKSLSNFYNINRLICSSIDRANILLIIIDINLISDDFFILDFIKNIKNKKKILIISKVDNILNKEVLFKFIWNMSLYSYFDAMFPISNKSGVNLVQLYDFLKNKFKVSFSSGIYNISFLEHEILDIIRKSLLIFLKHEIPYNIKIKIDNISTFNQDGFLYILFFINKISQKKIIIGKKGIVIKCIIKNILFDIHSLGLNIYFLKIDFKIDKFL